MGSGDFILGPYVTSRSRPSAVDDDLESTGCVLEFSTPDEAHTLEIVRHRRYSFQRRDFASYLIREIEMPFGIDCFQFQVKDLAGGPYITLSAFLAALYDLYDRATPIRRFFTDLAEILPFEDKAVLSLEDSKYPLRPEIRTKGYRVGSVMPYGRRILVYFVWMATPSSTSDSPFILNLGGADFRPRPDRSLGSGKWHVPRDHFIETHLFRKLCFLSNGAPAKVFTEQACSQLLADFDWSPLALMTPKQAREARLDFVRKHPELVLDHKALAKAMKSAQLYSDDTSVSQICKFLPSLLTPTATRSGKDG
jgi:hypothetical protein